MSLPDKFEFIIKDGDCRTYTCTSCANENYRIVTWIGFSGSISDKFYTHLVEQWVADGYWIILNKEEKPMSIFEQIRNFCKNTKSYVAITEDGFEVYGDNLHDPIAVKDEDAMIKAMEAMTVLHEIKNGE